jgi:hypothetical protein
VDYINLRQNRRIKFQRRGAAASAAGAAAAAGGGGDAGPVGGLPSSGGAGGGGGGSGSGSDGDGEGEVPADPPQSTPEWTATEVNP